MVLYFFSIRMTDTLFMNMVEAMSDVSLATSDVHAHGLRLYLIRYDQG